MPPKKEKDRKESPHATALGPKTVKRSMRNQAIGFTLGVAAGAALLFLRRRRRSRQRLDLEASPG